MKPAGYMLTRTNGSTALIKDEADAFDKAARGLGELTPLFSPHQIAEYLRSTSLDNAELIADEIDELQELL